MSEISLRVLIVEDNPADARLVLHELRNSGWTPDVTRVETEAEFLLNLDLAPDVVLCDYNLPQFDALRALELLRERKPNIPFLIVSGSIGEETAVNAMKHGATDYLLKDRLSRLGPAVKQALDQQKLREAERQAQLALRASEARLKLAQTAAGMGVWEWDIPSGSIIWSSVCSPIPQPERFEGNLTDFTNHIHPDDIDRVMTAARDAIASRTSYSIEYRVRRPKDEDQWISNLGQCEYNASGAPIRLVGTVQDITERKRMDDELRASRERLQVLSRQLMSAQEDERRHIARELHDEIGQALTGIKLNLNTLQRSIQSEADKAVWQDTLAITHRTLEQVRNLSLDLRPSMLDDLGLAAALRWYLDRQAQRAGFASQFVAELSETGASKEIETACFRIAQECLTNISRHAQARHVRVELHRRDSELELLVIDDGIGFDVYTARERATRGTSLGLLGMQERMLLLGGQLTIESVLLRGTQVRACFPITVEPHP